MMEYNPYKILDLPDNTKLKKVKQRFRELSHTMHPDKGGDEEIYKIIIDAYKRIINGFVVRKHINSVKTDGNLTKTEYDTSVDVHITLDEAFNGCSRKITFDDGDYINIKIKPHIGYMETVSFSGRGRKNELGVRTNLFVTVIIDTPERFSFNKHNGKYMLCYTYCHPKDHTDIFYVNVNGEGRYVQLPCNVKNGMYLRVPEFGYYCDGKRQDLYVKVVLL